MKRLDVSKQKNVQVTNLKIYRQILLLHFCIQTETKNFNLVWKNIQAFFFFKKQALKNSDFFFLNSIQMLQFQYCEIVLAQSFFYNNIKIFNTFMTLENKLMTLKNLNFEIKLTWAIISFYILNIK